MAMTLDVQGDMARAMVAPAGAIAADAVAMAAGLSWRRAAAIAGLADDWRTLEQSGVATCYQRLDFVAPWLQAHAARCGEPVLIEIRRGETAAMILPLVVKRERGCRVARFPGASHANHNMPLFRPDLIGADQVGHLKAILAAVAAEIGIDAYVFDRQPREWNGHINPLPVALGAAASPVIAQQMDLAGGFEALLERHGGASKRKNQKTKEKVFRAAGDYRFDLTSDPAMCHTVLDAFFEQKAARLALQGISDPFTDPAARNFFHALADLGGSGRPILEMGYISAAGRIRAVAGCAVQGAHRSIMFLSFAQDDLSRSSPGKVLVFRLLERLGERQASGADFGVGWEAYKDSWADGTFDLVDTCVAMTPLGRLYVAARRARVGAEAFVRGNPRLWAIYRRLRPLLGRVMGRRPAVTPSADDADGQ